LIRRPDNPLRDGFMPVPSRGACLRIDAVRSRIDDIRRSLWLLGSGL